MISTILIDDEAHCIARLSNLLETYCAGQLEIVATASDVASAKKAIAKHKPDAIFLDVQIEGQTGFDLLEELVTINFAVVFTTAFEHYAIQAIRFSAFDYLLKPIDPDDLKTTVEKLSRQHSNKQAFEPFALLFENMRQLKNQHRKIAVPHQNELLFLNTQDIVRCKSDVNYTTLYLCNKKKILVAKTLKEFEALLTPMGFCRVHNSHLINLDYVNRYTKGKGGYVHLEDGAAIEVSSRRKDELLQRLAKL
ncbi:MAG TPA: LytTR family DNA-binding domain-containing protein [Flavobacterium sp.]|nr:LytTR family DNA-binding domain-containing protein [Flavobacterium sp.]